MQAPTHNRTEMFSMIELWKGSGLSQKVYCRQQNIPYHVFHYWYKVYRDHHAAGSSRQTSFVPLHMEAALTHSALMELVLPDGKRILFHQQPATDFIKALL